MREEVSDQRFLHPLHFPGSISLLPAPTSSLKATDDRPVSSKAAISPRVLMILNPSPEMKSHECESCESTREGRAPETDTRPWDNGDQEIENRANIAERMHAIARAVS